MALADTKKVQTMINIVAEQAEIIREAVEKMKAARTLFQSVNPDTTGTPLAGNEAAVSNAINGLDSEASEAVWTQMIAARIPSHRNQALS